MTTVPTPSLRHVLTVRVEVSDPVPVGRVPGGTRRVVPITGGTVSGPLGAGTVLPLGADYQMVGEEVSHLEARYVLEFPGGHRVAVDNRAVRVASTEDSRSIARGVSVDPARVYFRCAPVLTADEDGPWSWVNRTVFVGTGERDPDCVRLEFFVLE